ncbi:MAG: FUSC family protein [Pseudonocardiales bacterium]|nr:FUSC family protein [Pseudonocardiales bacterium]
MPQPVTSLAGWESPAFAASPTLVTGMMRLPASLSWLRQPLVQLRTKLAPVTEAALAAGLAWGVAHMLFPSQQATFAPFSAIVALGGGRGGRGARALLMLIGVLVGVGVGELTVRTVGSGSWQVGFAAGMAMLLVSPLLVDSLALIQAGVAAAIVVATGNQATGYTRFLDAVIGAAIALLMTQVLFTPNPVRLLSKAAIPVLGAIGEVLNEVARGLSERDSRALDDAIQRLRAAHKPLAAFTDTQPLTRGMARRTIRGRRHADELAALDHRLDGLSALYTSAAALVRGGQRLVMGPEDVLEDVAAAVATLGQGTCALAEKPDGFDARRQAARCAAAVEGMRVTGADQEHTLLLREVRQAGTDLSRIAGHPPHGGSGADDRSHESAGAGQ